MVFTEETINNVLILKLKGRLDASTSRDVKEKVTAIANRQKANIVFDMTDVDFIDSSGLGVLVASLRSVKESGGDIKIAALQDKVRAIFELTRLHRLFGIYNDNLTAAESYQS